MNLFYIAPYSKDKDFFAKFSTLEKVCSEYDVKIFKGVLSNGNFNLEKTLKLYKKADFFIADLSYERPSCYYELGFAQALQKEVFLIAQKNTDIHQAIGRNEVAFFQNIKEYEEIINQILQKIPLEV